MEQQDKGEVRKVGKYLEPNPIVEGPYPEVEILNKAIKVGNLLGFSLKKDDIAALRLKQGDQVQIRIINKSKQI